jgi:hypothetical protein
MSPQSLQSKSAVAATIFAARDTLGALFAVAAELIIVMLALSEKVPFAVAVELHFTATVVLALILFRGRMPNEDLTAAALLFLVVLAAGPAGAVASLLSRAFANRTRVGPEVLEAWYQRLSSARTSDASTELTDRVVAGRVIDTRAPPPEHFEDVIANGTLAEKQAALGHMARHFHTDFAPALEAALRSPEPVVRVQAAAVVARVRSILKPRIKLLLADKEGRTIGHELKDAAELARLAACTLVDRADAEKCRAASTKTLGATLDGPDSVRTAAAAATRDTAIVIENHLFANQRFGDFRVARRIHSIVLDRTYRVRLIAGERRPA